MPLLDLSNEVVARGALEAARRHSEGEPVYFDFLPQISTIVWGEQGAASYDLIEAGETLPAGRVYRSSRPARFAIQSGQSEFSVHLRKELVKWPRKARVDIGAPVASNVPVALSVEQVPAAGRARLIIEAPMLARQFTIDWDGATEIEKPWEELVAELDDAPRRSRSGWCCPAAWRLGRTPNKARGSPPFWRRMPLARPSIGLALPRNSPRARRGNIAFPVTVCCQNRCRRTPVSFCTS
ncbi:hypothetical protein ACFP8Z_01755 [Gemmobacter lanyuensis]|uniref:hypothetical protein n=1 Tax=Gemmobacter lanyuensis TaxID=1054497 RepID=UPI003615B44A